MEITVRYIPGVLADRLRRNADQAPNTLGIMLEKVGERAVGIAQSLAPVGSGRYRAGLKANPAGSGPTQTVEIGSDAHGYVVEHGRPPGRMPPPPLIAALYGLSQREGFLVARAIGRTGTRGVPVLDMTRQQMANDARQLGDDLLRSIGDLGT